MDVTLKLLEILCSEIRIIENPIFEVPHRLTRENHDIVKLQTPDKTIGIISIDDLHEAINPLELFVIMAFHLSESLRNASHKGRDVTGIPVDAIVRLQPLW